MAAKRDYYDVLNINKSADDSTIKKAYRKLAKKYHPDTNAGNKLAEEKFKEVTEAYNVLSDKEKRKLYDQFGHAAFDGSMPNGQEDNSFHHTGSNSNYREYHFTEEDMDDILKNMFGGQRKKTAWSRTFNDEDEENDFFGHFGHEHFTHRGFGEGSFDDNEYGGFGNKAYDSRAYVQKGRDAEAQITISFDEAVHGCDKLIALSDGNGSSQSLKVHIPAGVDTGKSVRLRGKGNPGINGGEAGDLFLKVQVGEKAGYERKDMDVYTVINIPFTTAVFGGEVRVETLYGQVVCKIAPGTQSKTRIRLRGKGIVSMKNPKIKGDQYVEVQIQVPKNLDENAKAKLRDYEKACRKSSMGVA